MQKDPGPIALVAIERVVVVVAGEVQVGTTHPVVPLDVVLESTKNKAQLRLESVFYVAGALKR